MSRRLNGVFRTAVYALLLMVLSAVIAINQRLNEAADLDLVQNYSAALLRLDADLYRLQRDVNGVFYGGTRKSINSILADTESIWLDYDSMLGQVEAETHVSPPVRLVEHQATVALLRTSMLKSMLLLREGDVTGGMLLFEQGPRLYVEQLHNYVKLVLQATSEHLQQHREEARRARMILLTSLIAVIMVAVLMFRTTMVRLGETTTRLEVDLEDALVREGRQQRLSTLGQVAGTISHELRNPLGTIRTSVYNLGMREENQSPESRKILDRIERNVLRCDAIISSLLDYMRQPELQKSTINLLSWTLDLMAEQDIPEGIKLELPTADVGDIQFDPELIRRAVQNVYSNACQAIEAARGEQDADREGTLQISLLSKEGQVGIEFRDDGAGISADNLDKVFEPLFSTRSFGIGLGMQIVRQIMDQHDGSIEIESQENVGTRVTLWLPAREPEMRSVT
jgi:signal transduction histidine kinase